MTEGKAGNPRLVMILWIVAAVLAWTAVAIRYGGQGQFEWRLAAAGLFCFLMGVSTWVRSRRT
jgi:hypothetical protein